MNKHVSYYTADGTSSNRLVIDTHNVLLVIKKICLLKMLFKSSEWLVTHTVVIRTS